MSPVVTEEVRAPDAVTSGERTWIVIRTLLGLVLLLALAYAGGHPKVQSLERRLRISQVVTAGFPFVALGVIARLPSINILSDSVLSSLAPALRIALGWIGFLIGFRFDARRAIEAPARTFAFVTWRGAVTFGIVALACGAIMAGGRKVGGAPATLDGVLLRDAIILGVAGALTSLEAVRLLAVRGGSTMALTTVDHVLRLEELLGMFGLLAVAAYFRYEGADVAWRLPGTAWMFLTLGVGLAMGLLALAVLTRVTKSGAEALVLLLGVVAFGSGLASNLRLSPVVVCFLAGLVLGNAPGYDKTGAGKTLSTIERPIYLMFLLFVGALWNVNDSFGWVLLIGFVLARFAGKWLGTALGAKTQEYALDPMARRSLVVAPMGALSIAIVVSAELLYPVGAISGIITAIVGGAIITELIVQLSSRRSGEPPSSRTPGADPTPAQEDG